MSFIARPSSAPVLIVCSKFHILQVLSPLSLSLSIEIEEEASPFCKLPCLGYVIQGILLDSVVVLVVPYSNLLCVATFIRV